MTEAQATTTPSSDDSLKGTRIGLVESDKRDKTVKVVVGYVAKHPKYGKYLRRRTVLHAHDEHNDARLGDRVEVAPCRPISKTKSWRVVRIVDRAPENL